MKLQLERLQIDPDVTIGSLTVNGAWECYTAEGIVRPLGVKVPHSTAIPPGVYAVDITFSHHYRMPLPLLIKVPGFEDVRIYSSHIPGEADGFILVGLDRLPGAVGRSELAFKALFQKISRAKALGEPITIEVTA